eukprot:3714586-Lingulodinium_polyedra.AAC.1
MLQRHVELARGGRPRLAALGEDQRPGVRQRLRCCCLVHGLGHGKDWGPVLRERAQHLGRLRHQPMLRADRQQLDATPEGRPQGLEALEAAAVSCHQAASHSLGKRASGPRRVAAPGAERRALGVGKARGEEGRVQHDHLVAPDRDEV